MPTENEHDEIRKLLKENTALIRENNVLLKKMYRAVILSFFSHMLWYVFIIGVPVILYLIFEPYFDAAKDAFSHLRDMPGVRQFLEAFESYR